MRFLLLLVFAGCTLFEKSKPLDVRYFSPELAPATERLVTFRGDAVQPHAPRVRVRLGRVTASGHLRERIAYRETPVRLRLYDGRRWTEVPDEYVRRALTRALFEHQPLEQALGGAVPTLDVEVLAFEEVRPNTARVELAYRLHDDRTVIASGTITVERPVRGEGFEAIVATIAAAMTEAAERVGDVVSRSVVERSPRTTSQ